uniref:Uncharacterized protein n=1 Tax=Candidatus Kentrum sp. FM TaxID=2126340 RepID=A0A450TPT5_9GAMM|nr:MAG: hypothetical protein BECKFM1743C_GA0114222_105354 [Candidatus Kentron sp. FM]VFJ71867.1 MAG: hypothetical protein BECKFM1743A_GA0114220_106084 [Candidatus Kentron sp. FM]VFK19216.1 MAG: hypothetical protein BECKFM1743B_GA0114221_106034 [Candidatus Kentron sp. FM]
MFLAFIEACFSVRHPTGNKAISIKEYTNLLDLYRSACALHGSYKLAMRLPRALNLNKGFR